MTDYEIYSLQSYNDYIFENTRPTRRSSIEDLNLEELIKYVNKVKQLKPNFAKNNFDKCLKLCGITDNSEDKVYPTLAELCCLANIHKHIIHNYLWLV